MHEIDSTALADLLRQARQDLHLTAREVARRAGVDVGTVTRMELGQVKPKADNIKAIGLVLGISAADLFAAAKWLPKGELPSLRPYLRAKYEDLPEAAVIELEGLIQRYTGAGPSDGEDEK